MQTKRLLLTCSIFVASNLRTCHSFAPIVANLSHNHFSTETDTDTDTTTALTLSSTPIETMSEENEVVVKSASARIVSYNLLSSHLADPKFHTKCKPEDLSASNRLPKILAKLDEEIAICNKSVFCLQEVSHDWATALHVFFAERGYHMITGLYGRNFNGYMGIATAFPTEHFKMQKVDLLRLSDKKQDGWPRKPRAPEPSALRTYVFNPIYNPMKAAYRYYRPKKRAEDDAWDYSKYRYNQFIGVKLLNRCLGESASTSTSTPFWVGNYHMPCAFRTPAVMNIHADLVGSRIQKLAKGENGNHDPYVLAGDFNILPESPHYSLLKTGTLDEKDETYPGLKYDAAWKPNFKGMRSAYFELNGEEPEFTNASHNGAMNAESFIGTLDYVFMSDEWKVLQVKDTPKKEKLEGVYPNAEEPSDHVLIAASIEI